MEIILLILIASPFLLTIYNFVCVVRNDKKIIRRNILWIVTMVFGYIDSILYLEVGDVMFDSEWYVQLKNSQKHQPVWTGAKVTVCVLLLLGIIGAIILLIQNVNMLPPLIAVLCITSMYINIAIQCVWVVQCYNSFLLALVPLNSFFIMITIIKEKVKEWSENERHSVRHYGKNKLFKKLNSYLNDSKNWPVIAALFFLPLLGIIIMILTLFGQEPDSIIKAWTETSDWRLSLKEAPQNIYYDEHYLCTAAAGGHRKIVKPLRKGVRHGHPVIVNRQLLIANAFENVLEERAPRFHRAVRNFYDKHGFPIADMIRTNKIACDITYFVMKPLEWMFLIVLYLVDAKPENRIATQYITKPNGPR